MPGPRILFFGGIRNIAGVGDDRIWEYVIDPNNPRENIEICALEGNYFAFYTEKTKYSLEDLNVTRTTTGSTTTTTTTYTTSTTTRDPILATL